MKGQGLPINTIVLAILALLVLVILAAIFVPGFRNLIASLFGAGVTSVEAAKETCRTRYCAMLDQAYSATTLVDIKNSEWCTHEFRFYDPAACNATDRCWTQGSTAATCQTDATPNAKADVFSTNYPEKLTLSCSFTLTSGERCNPTDWDLCCGNPSLANCGCSA